MLVHYVVGTICLVARTVTSFDSLHPLSDEFIQNINEQQSTWTAGRNFPAETPMEFLKTLNSVKNPDPDIILELPKIRHHDEFIARLPENFDSRKKWTDCPSIREIRDQGFCGSCWAISAVETMTDRICIHSNGTRKDHLSTDDLISCCGEEVCGGCEGGNPWSAWSYWQKHGIVSGGEYRSNKGCRPYEIAPCKHGVLRENRPKCDHSDPTPTCKKTCIKGYKKTYEEDLVYGSDIYKIGKEEEQIKAEIYKNGPVQANFHVFEDFLSYKSGVYQNVKGSAVGYHAIKIIGYGVENGVKYWLIANSWNTDWGDNGYVKFLRGEDHCGIESGVIGGRPKLS